MSIYSQVSQVYFDNWVRHFWEKVELTSGCWNWKGHKNRYGYGRVAVLHDGPRYVAHRVAYELVTGEVLDPDTVLLHICDNPSCVNPDHLQPGTQLDNIRDCIKKGRFNYLSRGSVGVDNPGCKLKQEQVENLIKDRESGLTYSQLVKKYNISKTQVGRICTKASWKHLSIKPL